MNVNIQELLKISFDQNSQYQSIGNTIALELMKNQSFLQTKSDFS